MRIALVPEDAPYVAEHAELVQSSLRAASAEIVRDAAIADAVLLLPHFGSKFRDYPDQLLARFSPSTLSKLLVFEGCDAPIDFLPGLYVNARSKHLRRGELVQAISYLRPRTDSVGPGVVQPKWLFTFRGAISHGVRRRLLRQLSGTPRASLTPMNNWMNYSLTQRQDFVAEILASQFVLCPRGIGASTIRLQEVMELGRCPVVISDDWVAPSGPEWEGCVVRVRERDIPKIPQILSALEPNARQMGDVARDQWEKFLAPGAPFGNWMLGKLKAVQRARTERWDPAEELHRWRSLGFAWHSELDVYHRARRKAAAARASRRAANASSKYRDT